MAKGRTISAALLTNLDRQVIELCLVISLTIEKYVAESQRKQFRDEFGKTHLSRDAGLGRGAGKLQRDALCTRGIQGNAPFSNRNLRWHPLVAAYEPISFAKEIDKIEIEGTDQAQSLIFHVTINGRNEEFPSERVYELPERFVVLPKHWAPHVEQLRYWNDTLWTQNSCIITAYEACDWQDAVEAYAILGIAIAVNVFGAEFQNMYDEIVNLLANQELNKKVNLPSENFPASVEAIANCPLCRVSLAQPPANRPRRVRESRWKPDWGNDKRGEGEDESLQIMHVNPLTEREMRHNAQNVRFGHRWCNVAMTDHSIDETIHFMEYIVKAHGR